MGTGERGVQPRAKGEGTKTKGGWEVEENRMRKLAERR